MGGQSQTQWGGQINALADMEVDRLAERLLEQETVSAEEFQLMIAENGRYMAPYELYDQPASSVQLPFQSQPTAQELRPTAGLIAGSSPAPEAIPAEAA